MTLDLVDDLLRFIDASPTPFHAVAEVRRRLDAAGYRALDEGEPWEAAPGSRFYTVRGEASLAAFQVGVEPPAVTGFRLVGAHTDWPNLRIKPNPTSRDGGCVKLGVEPYGGVLWYTWLDRDLSLAGRVLVDGVDVRDWQLASLRRQIAIIEQDIFLFSRSIAENIAFGRPEASRDEIEAAARAAQAHDFILAFPEGYETVIGERGVTLSGGQRQRIAIARAILTDPRVLILDDSTSAIDSRTEDQIQRAIQHAARGRTTVLITHRLSQIRWADQVVVLRGGQVEAAGRHEELLVHCEPYRRIFVRLEHALGAGPGNGAGILNVTGGGRVNSVNGFISFNTGSQGMATVSGPGSRWTNSASLSVGHMNHGTLIVSNGGTVDAMNLTVRATGELLGDGNIVGSVGNSGFVSPGTSPGALSMSSVASTTRSGSSGANARGWRGGAVMRVCRPAGTPSHGRA